jgi:P4 family phage/plasmid primase-like protien
MNADKIRKSASELESKGICTVPIQIGEKRPTIKDWTIGSTRGWWKNLERFPHECNLGIVLGPLSDGLVAVDLDIDTKDSELMRIVDATLPDTPAIEGRLGRPRSHLIYRLSSAEYPESLLPKIGSAVREAMDAEIIESFPGKSFWLVPGGKIELLAAGQQFVCPPSQHPTGERRQWQTKSGKYEEPSTVEYETLIASLDLLAERLGGTKHEASGLIKIKEELQEILAAASIKDLRECWTDSSALGRLRQRRPGLADEVMALSDGKERANRAQAILSGRMKRNYFSVEWQGGNATMMSFIYSLHELGMEVEEAAPFIEQYNSDAVPPWEQSSIGGMIRSAWTRPWCPPGIDRTEAIDDFKEHIEHPEMDSRRDDYAMNQRSKKIDYDRLADDWVKEFYPGGTLRCFDREPMAWQNGIWSRKSREWLNAEIEKAHGSVISGQSVSRVGADHLRKIIPWRPGIYAAPPKNPQVWLNNPGREARRWVVLANGMISLDEILAGKGRLHSHTPEFFTRWNRSFDYNPEAEAPFFEEAMRAWFPDPTAREGALAMMWALLSGWRGHQKLFFLIGPPGTGKSTFTKLVECLLGGQEAVTALDYLQAVTRFVLQDVPGKAVVILSEANEVNHLPALVVDLIKRVTGGDVVSIERKGQDAYTARAEVNMLMVGNKIPYLLDDSGALADRFYPIPMGVRFRGEEGALDEAEVEARFRLEAPGILNAVLEAGRRHGFALPPLSVEGKKKLLEVRLQTNPLSEFIQDCLVVEPGSWVSNENLYYRYQEWCIDAGESPRTKSAFIRALGAQLGSKIRIQERKRTGKNRREKGVRGLRLRTGTEVET